jgi:hypothetical protein
VEDRIRRSGQIGGRKAPLNDLSERCPRIVGDPTQVFPSPTLWPSFCIHIIRLACRAMVGWTRRTSITEKKMESIHQNASPSRRQMVKAGMTLAAAPVVLAAGSALAAEAGGVGGDVAETTRGGATIADPRTEYPRPPFPKQQQEAPGLALKMEPQPDHGENTYRGSGKLAGRRAPINHWRGLRHRQGCGDRVRPRRR